MAEIKGKIAQILLDSNEWWNPRTSASDVAEVLMAELRCERCKHWEGEAGEHDPAAQTTEACARLGFIATAPDFFCAEWSSKESPPGG